MVTTIMWCNLGWDNNEKNVLTAIVGGTPTLKVKTVVRGGESFSPPNIERPGMLSGFWAWCKRLEERLSGGGCVGHVVASEIPATGRNKSILQNQTKPKDEYFFFSMAKIFGETPQPRLVRLTKPEFSMVDHRRSLKRVTHHFVVEEDEGNFIQLWTAFCRF